MWAESGDGGVGVGGFLDAVLPLQGRAEVGQSGGLVRPEAQGLSVRGDGFVETAQPLQDHTEIAVVVRAIPRDRNRLADPFDGHLVTAALVVYDAKQVQGIGVAWVAPEDLMICGLGPVQVTSLVRTDSNDQGLGYRKSFGLHKPPSTGASPKLAGDYGRFS
jgi:hypothetical protein